MAKVFAPVLALPLDGGGLRGGDGTAPPPRSSPIKGEEDRLWSLTS